MQGWTTTSLKIQIIPSQATIQIILKWAMINKSKESSSDPIVMEEQALKFMMSVRWLTNTKMIYMQLENSHISIRMKPMLPASLHINIKMRYLLLLNLGRTLLVVEPMSSHRIRNCHRTM